MIWTWVRGWEKVLMPGVSGKSNEDWNSQFLITEGWVYPL